MSTINHQSVTIHNHSETTTNGDWILVELVGQVNISNLEIGIVLNFGGEILSGTLVGGTRYFDELKRQMMAAGKIDDSLHSALEKIVDQGKSLYNVAAEDSTKRPPEYLHLIDVYFPSKVSELGSVKLSTWRGKISNVSGFELHIKGEVSERIASAISSGSSLGSSILGIREPVRLK